MLAPVLREFGVTFRVMHGYSSATTVYDVAAQSARDRRQRVALYVGDWDPSGLHISELDLPNRLDRHGGLSVFIQRVALREDHVRRGDLPSFRGRTNAAILGMRGTSAGMVRD